ncbi:MAG: ABC transporter permease [Verrucomicrobiota bacterium]|nr:ABC transporter permease [Verrucomicrobiota bacterium]
MLSLSAIASVAYKEFLHIYRDKRVLVLLLVLPPFFTLMFGHAFENTERTEVPTLLVNRDATERTQRFLDVAMKNKTFAWKIMSPDITNEADLLGRGVQGALVIPQGWSEALVNGNPKPLQFYVDGSDTNTGDQLQGSLQKSLADFQLGERNVMIEALPVEVFDLGEKLPKSVRDEFTSAMTPWEITPHVLYNPKTRFIEYVTPGIIGLILQLLTVTLMACTIAREREAGTLYQLMVTSLRRGEIVLGKIVPYLVVSALIILIILLLTAFHFQVQISQPAVIALVCLLFLLCSLGLGLIISAISRSQTQAIQFSVFFLLPVFVLSGAFAPLEQLPAAIRWIAELFPLTHFCRAFRLVNLYHAGPRFYGPDLLILFVGAFITFVGAAFLLKRIEE